MSIQRSEQFRQLRARSVVVLGDGEGEGVSESVAGGDGVVQRPLAFAEEDVDNHPVGFPRRQFAEMIGGFAVFAGVVERLGETEAGQIVLGKLGEPFAGLGDALLTHAAVIWFCRAR